MSTIDWNTVAIAAANRPTQLRRREHVNESAAGEPLHRTVRVDYSDESKRIWQQRFVDGEWQNGLGEDFKTVLYQLPLVAEKAKTGGLVLLVEGEKVANAITALGITATTAAMGAGSWFDDYALPLVGAHVVLCPDCDLEGRRHVVQAGQSLLGAGVAVHGPLELHAEEQGGFDLYDLLAEYAETLRAVDPGLDWQAVRDRLRQLLQKMILSCPRATLESLAGYFELVEWRVDPWGRKLRHCDRCGRDRPHTIRAGLAFCGCGGHRQA